MKNYRRIIHPNEEHKHLKYKIGEVIPGKRDFYSYPTTNLLIEGKIYEFESCELIKEPSITVELTEKFDLEESLHFLAVFYGGSHQYGLNTLKSDIDYRGVFANYQKSHILGTFRFDSKDKVTDEYDYLFYEVRKMIDLIRGGNPQGFELLFMPSETFLYLDSDFDKYVRENRDNLKDTKACKYSMLGGDKCIDAKTVQGYVGHELRLASGERSGKEGGKRHDTIQNYGYSPKNYVQIFRLIFATKTFFQTGIFPVNMKTEAPSDFYNRLMDIKTNPYNYKKEDLQEESLDLISDLFKVYNDRVLNFKFDYELANDILYKIYMKYLRKDNSPIDYA